MARKELIIQIQEPGRDQGKAYFVREMPAMRSYDIFLTDLRLGDERSDELL